MADRACDIDKSVQDPYQTCPYCSALPCARCRGEDLSEIEVARLRAKLKREEKGAI